MKITITKSSLAECTCNAAVVTHFEDDAELTAPGALINEKAGGIIQEIIERGDFRGKKDQISLVYTRSAIPAPRVIIVGLGRRDDFVLDTLRGAYAKAARYARALNLKTIATCPACLASDEAPDRITEAVVEGAVLGTYQFNRFKTLDREEIREIEEFIITEDRADVFKIVRAAAKKAEAICTAVSYVRDLVSMPANAMTPTDLANEALASLGGKKDTKVRVLDVEEMEELGMNALLAVARGSSEPAKFIIVEYKGGRRSEQPLVLVGKAITFDSGGISLKPAEGMDEMKSDMAGGAAVMGAIVAAADLKLPVNCIGLIPATENKPGSAAFRPGDVLKALAGKTIEVLSTDAEGRLILADALTYADRFHPAAIIDVATLTGACIIALGDHTIGMMGTSGDLKNRLRAAADHTGERVWELPLWDEYHEQIKSDIADFKNTGGRPAGTITAACFLSKFVGDYPWVHLDIAGPAWLKKDRPYIPKGASGAGVRILVQFLREWSSDKHLIAGREKRDGGPA